MAKRENELIQTILSYLQIHGFVGFRQNTGAMKQQDRYVAFGNPGTPDILGYTSKETLCQFFGIEVKLRGGRLNRNQVVWHERAKRHGCLAYVAWDSNWKEVCDQLIAEAKVRLTAYGNRT